jgi:hypothetical protein
MLKVFTFIFVLTNTAFADTDTESLNEAIVTIGRIKNDLRNAARTFAIPPTFVAGAILAEHALNVDWRDRWQNRVIRNDWSRNLFTRGSNAALVDLLQSERVRNNCNNLERSYNFWYCVIRTRYALSFIIPTNENYKRFTNEYFNPNNIGSTFGLGQLSPLRAMMVSDLVASRTNIPEIDFTDDNSRYQLYNDLMNPSRVVYYVAATIAQAIAIYRSYGFEIGDDLGVAVTLYNIGNESFHAQSRQREGGNPEPNSMGRWAEANINLIEAAIR